MRLTIEQVEKISRIILDKLKEKGIILFKVDEDVVLKRITELFLKDLQAEDELEREVENIMKQHAGEMDRGKMDYRKMFMMIKNKLAKERGIVL
ncbi:MAG: DUF507 family protein [Deltaproteobacteria bacterium]|nr:DUF507 family protein [Deltaproteobacteria bacterium]